MKKLNAVTLILSDARGHFIPRDFVTDDFNNVALDHCKAWGLNESNLAYWIDCANPDSENYYESWDWILDNAKLKDADCNVYRLHQDGDLWGLCFDRMTDEEKTNFGFEE